jgi:hypothetical protein
MTEHQASRTLVKSAPELWAECSDAASLARHLGAFAEIRITRLEPETTVAWEGDAACGTVQLESAGWGTRVTLTMTETAPATAPAPAQGPEPGAAVADEAAGGDPVTETVTEPDGGQPVSDDAPAPRRGFLARIQRIFGQRAVVAVPDVGEPADQGEPVTESEPVAESAPVAESEPVAESAPSVDPATDGASAATAPTQSDGAAGESTLAEALDSLGRAHRRPYSHT